jgi:hypothetical protein
MPNDGNYLPDPEHPFNVGPCPAPGCGWDVYAPEVDTEAIHFACDLARQRVPA